MSTQNGNFTESKMQEIGSSWDTPSNNDPNDSSWQLSAEKDYGVTPNMNSTQWSCMSVAGASKEVEYASRDLPLSIQSVFRNRSIGSHKEKSNDTVTKQAVKIASYEAASPAASGQISHKSSLYKKLANKHMPINAMKQTYEITKDSCQESVESLKRHSDDINDEVNKLIAAGKQDEISKRRTPAKGEYPEEKVTSPLSILSRKSNSMCNMEKEMNPPNFHNLVARKSQSKIAQLSSEDWPLPESRNSQRFPWDGSTSMVKEKTTNPENEMLYQTYDPNFSFKLDM